MKWYHLMFIASNISKNFPNTWPMQIAVIIFAVIAIEKMNSRVFIALFFMAVIVSPIMAQHYLSPEVYAVEWSTGDDSEKESSKELLDDLTKDWIHGGWVIDQSSTGSSVIGLNAAYQFIAQQASIGDLLDPPEHI